MFENEENNLDVLADCDLWEMLHSAELLDSFNIEIGDYNE